MGFDTEGMYPAASMNVGQAAHFNFGYSPFMYAPIDSSGSSFQPVTEAVGTNGLVHPDFTSTARMSEYEANPELIPSGSINSELQHHIARVVGEDSTEAKSTENYTSDQRNIGELLPRRTQGRHGGEDEIGNRHSGSRSYTSASDSDIRDGVGQDVPHLEHQRQGLVDNLIGMGFPVEWAIRAAERSGEKCQYMHCSNGGVDYLFFTSMVYIL